MKIASKWGILLGVAICVWTSVVHLVGWYTVDIKQGERADIVAIILPIIAIGMAVWERRRANPGQTLTIAQGMATGIVTGLVSVPIAAGFLWFYHHQINPAWVDHLVAYHTATMRAAGASDVDIGAKVDALRRTGKDSAQLVGALAGTTLISIFISLIFSVMFRRSAASRS